MRQETQGYVGSENLELMESAARYLQFVGRLVAGQLPSEGTIVEFGAGSGTQTVHVMEPSSRLTCVEINPELQKVLAAKGYQIAGEIDEFRAASLAAVYSINCIEHIEDDGRVLQQILDRLVAGGRLVLYVPAMPVLFSSMDRLVGHHRRYRRRSLMAAVTDLGFVVREARYIDSLGVFPSFVYRCLPKASGVPSARSIALYDKYLFPVSRVVDRVAGKLLGKNLFLVAEKR